MPSAKNTLSGKGTYRFHVRASVRDWNAIGKFWERNFSVVVAADSDAAIIHAINQSGFEVEKLISKELIITP